MLLFGRDSRAWVLGSMLALAAITSHAGIVNVFHDKQNVNLSLIPPPPVLADTLVGTQVSSFNGAISEVLGGTGFEGGAINFSYGSGATATFSPSTLALIDGRNASQGPNGTGRYNMTPDLPNLPTGGPNPGHWIEATSSFDITFSSAITAFAFFGTDFADFSGAFSLQLVSNGTVIYDSLDEVGGNGANGNLMFFGVVSSVAFDRVNFFIAQSSPDDVFGFDEFVVGTGTPSGQTPEPGTLALVGLALAGAGFAQRRRRR